MNKPFELLKIVLVLVLLVFGQACQKAENITPEPAVGISAQKPATAISGSDKVAYSTAQVTNPNGLTIQLVNPVKLGNWEKTITAQQWLPAVPSKYAMTYKFETGNVKTVDITTGVSAAVCSKADALIVLFEACADARNTYANTLSMNATTSISILLKPYEQRRYVVKQKYVRYKGTIKIAGTTPLTNPDVVYDIPIGSVFSAFESRILK